VFVTTLAVYDIETGNCERREGFFYKGSTALLKGPTADQQELAKEQGSFYRLLVASYSKMFSGQTNILKALNTAMQPILQAGPGQFGLGKAEETALRTQASETTARQFASSARGLRERLAARGEGNVFLRGNEWAPGGGSVFLPSGAEAQLEAGLYQQAAQTEAQQQLGITGYGYDVGRKNYWEAAGALGGVAGLMAPTSYASGATSAGSAAGTTWADIVQEQQAASPWATIGGVLGGVAGMALGGYTGRPKTPAPSPTGGSV
jgi:hypothetical protein